MKADTRTYTVSGHDRRLRTYITGMLWLGIILVGGFVAHKFEANQAELLEAQAKADKAALRAQLTITSSPYASLMTTDEGWIVESNLAAELLTGYQHEELIGKSAIDLLVPEEHREQVTREMHNAVAKARGDDGNFFLLQKDSHVPIVHKGGDEIPMVVSVRIIKFMDEIQFIVGMRAEKPEQAPIQPSQPVPIPEFQRGVSAMLDRAVDQMAAEIGNH